MFNYYKLNISDAGSARQSINEGPGADGLSLGVKKLSKGQPVNHFQVKIDFYSIWKSNKHKLPLKSELHNFDTKSFVQS